MNWLVVIAVLAILYLFVFHGHNNDTGNIHLKRFVGYQNGSQ